MTAAAKRAAVFLVVISAAISEANEFVKSSKSANSQSADDSHTLFLSFLKVSEKPKAMTLTANKNFHEPKKSILFVISSPLCGQGCEAEANDGCSKARSRVFGSAQRSY